MINAARCFLHQILDGLEISFYVRTVRRSVSEGMVKEWQIIIHLEGAWQGFNPEYAEKSLRKRLDLPDSIPIEIKIIEKEPDADE